MVPALTPLWHPALVTGPGLRALALCLALQACAPTPPAPPPPAPATPPEAATPPPSAATLPPSGEVGTDGGPDGDPGIDLVAVLFPDAATTLPGAASCLPLDDPSARARCLFGARYQGDVEAARIAIELFETSGSVAGVQIEQDMDGGFRGLLHLVPEVPLGAYRRHLEWAAAATRDFDTFFAHLEAPAAVRYRVRPLALRFFRSVGRTTPSAYAEGWSVSYNVAGSLHTSAAAVRETLFHEVFHLNDAAHGDWSKRTLQPLFDAIVARCGTRVACLRAYAPGDTMVRGGTYYAFQPDNGESVHEYGAELALRWYREQRSRGRGPRAPRSSPAFKCGPEENRRAWAALVAEFFGGADGVPACDGSEKDRIDAPL